VTWNVLGARTPGGTSNGALYPLLDQRGRLVLEDLDGKHADLVASGVISVFEETDDGYQRTARIPYAEIYLTAGRIAFVAKEVVERDVLGGIGTALETVVNPVEALVGAVVEGRFRRRKKPEEIAAGHVRWPWLRLVAVRLAAGDGKSTGRLRMSVGDGTQEPSRQLMMECELPQACDVVAIGEAIVRSCATYRLGHYDFDNRPALRAEWEEVAGAQFEDLCVDRVSAIYLPNSFLAHSSTAMPP
jgi:hypothetical protein